MTANKIAIILGLIALTLIIAGYWHIEQSIFYGAPITARDDLLELNHAN